MVLIYDVNRYLCLHESDYENIGKTADELVAMWNADNPADLVE